EERLGVGRAVAERGEIHVLDPVQVVEVERPRRVGIEPDQGVEVLVRPDDVRDREDPDGRHAEPDRVAPADPEAADELGGISTGEGDVHQGEDSRVVQPITGTRSSRQLRYGRSCSIRGRVPTPLDTTTKEQTENRSKRANSSDPASLGPKGGRDDERVWVGSS